jgi:hypothetical protein
MSDDDLVGAARAALVGQSPALRFAASCGTSAALRELARLVGCDADRLYRALVRAENARLFTPIVPWRWHDLI